MARLGTANSMGTIIGPAVSGALATFGLLAPLYFAAGLVSTCPAVGFVAGPICAGALYQVHPPLAPMFSAGIFFLALVMLSASDR